MSKHDDPAEAALAFVSKLSILESDLNTHVRNIVREAQTILAQVKAAQQHGLGTSLTAQGTIVKLLPDLKKLETYVQNRIKDIEATQE